MSIKMKIVVGGSAILVTVALFGAVVVIRKEQAAESFLSQSRALVLGHATLSDARKTLDDYRRYQLNATSCASNECEIAFRFRNSLLSLLHLAPPTGLDSFLRFHDGILVNRETYLGQGLCCVVYVREDLPSSQTATLKSSFSRKLQRDGTGRPWKAIVYLTPQAIQQEKDLAYSFNLRCLYKIGGCKTAEELSPAIWKKGD